MRVRLAVAVALLMLSDSSAAAAGPPLARIALHLSDLRPGYTRLEDGYSMAYVSASDARSDISTLRGRGWEAAYFSAFIRLDASSDYFTVSDSIDVFRTASGAQWMYNRLVDFYCASLPGSQPLALTTIGDASAGCDRTGLSSVIFRSEGYVLHVTVSADAQRTAVPIAELLYHRIQAAQAAGR